MEYILNEIEWAEDHIERSDLGTNGWETLVRLTKYYKAQGYHKDKIQNLLEDFLYKCCADASIPRWRETITSAIRYGTKKEPVVINKLVVTKPEMQKIRDLKYNGLQALAFTLLVYSKYWDAINPQNSHWVNADQKMITGTLGYKVTTDRFITLLRQLRDAGYIVRSKRVDNFNFQVLFTEDGDVEYEVTSMKSLGNQCMNHLYGGYYQCANCGEWFKHTSKNKNEKYCKRCAEKSERESNRMSNKRYREAHIA